MSTPVRNPSVNACGIATSLYKGGISVTKSKPPLQRGESGAAAGGCTVRIRKKTAPVRRQALFGVEHYYFFGTRRSVPPIYGCKALGTSTLPSACKLFSRKAMSILGGATTVLFRVWAR